MADRSEARGAFNSFESARRNVTAAASALNTVPSWNLTPCRNVKSMDFLSPVNFQLVASPGATSPLPVMSRSDS